MINQSVLEAKRNVLKSGRAKRILEVEAGFEADRSGSEAPFRRRSFGATWMWTERVESESSGLERMESCWIQNKIKSNRSGPFRRIWKSRSVVRRKYIR